MLKAQFQELVVGDGGLTSFIKLLLDAGTTILKFANSDIGQLIIKIGLLYTALILASKGFAALNVAKLISDFTGFIGIVGSTTGAVNKLITALELLNINPVVAGLTALVGAGFAIKEIVDALNVTFDESIDKLNELNSEYQSNETEIESLGTTLDDVRKRIEEIQNLGTLSITDEKELDDLLLQEASLERQIALLNQKQEILNKQKAEEIENALSSGVDYGTYAGFNEDIGLAMYDQGFGVEPSEALNAYTSSLKLLEQEIISTSNEMSKLEEEGKTNSQEYEDLKNKIDILNDEYDSSQELASELAEQLITLSEATGGTNKEIEDAIDGWKDWANEGEDAQKELGNTADESDKASQAIEDLGIIGSSAMSSMNEATSEQQDAISALASDISDITSAYQTAVDALYEYNNQGYLSVDTYSQLMQLAPEYLAMMINENGQLYANADAVTTAYQAKVYLMGVEAAEAQVSLAASMAANQGAGAYAALGSQAINTAGSLWELVKARMADKIAAVEDPRDLAALENRINAINDLTQSTIANAKYTTASIKPTNASTAATNRNTGARNANADATKAQTEALKAQKEALEAEADALEKELDDYEIVIDYVKDLLKEEQEAVEEEKDAQLEAIQDKIDALEEEQEVFEENVNAQIEALEKQKDEIEDYWDAQIDAINDANDALEENMELQRLQEALASAKTQKVKVLKGGKFVYAEDEEAISKAEQELADYEQQLAVQRQIAELEKLKEEALSSLEKQIEELENYRDEQKKNYEQQLKDLQNHYDAVEEEYDIRIKQYDAWLKEFEDMLEASSKRHAEILYNELVGEQGNWNARIKALATFVQNYEAKKNELDGIKNQINDITNQISSLESQARTLQNNVNGIANQVGQQLSNISNMADQAEQEATRAYEGYEAVRRIQFRGWFDTGLGKVYITGWHNSYEAAKEALNQYLYQNLHILQTPGVSTGVDQLNKWATGTFSVPDDQIALVADPMRPSNRELVVGSKINKGNGILSSLKKDSGVIPSGRNFTEQLVNLARWSSNGGFERTFTTMNQSSSKTVHIENINLPNVSNGEEFVRYLETNFVNDSLQFANIRG